ncbi:MAG: polysaccharide biosynthesis tyrosine autokinase [Planctomycetes bacterium]|nr:polysaccharide biosynthesis tyrosine autokinase [Planctomycetota bacterium]
MKHELEFHADALPGHVNPDDEAERLPINYVQLAIRFKWWLLCGLAVGAVLGHLAYTKAGPEYEAVGSMLVSRKYMPPVRESERMLQDTGKPSEHIPLIVSPMIAEKAIRIGQLQDLPTFRGEPDIVEAVLEGLKAKRIAGQDRSHFNVIEIRYACRIAADAHKVVESIIAGYAEYLGEQSLEHSREVLNLAQKATAELRTQIDLKEDAYHDFLQTVPEEYRSALGPKMPNAVTTNIAPEDVIHALGEERNRNRIRQAELNSRQKSIETALAAGDPRDAIEQEVRRFMSADGRSERNSRSTEISAYQQLLIPLLLREQDLSRDFGKDHPELISVRQSITKIVETYRKLGVQLPEGVEVPASERTVAIDYIGMYRDSLKRQIHELELKDRELASLIKQEGSRSSEFSRYRATDQELRAGLTQLQELWKKRMDREGEVVIEKDTSGYTMKTLAPVKEALVMKRLMKFYAGGSLFGMFVVAIVVLVRELRDLTLKDVKDVRVTLKQPVLGSVIAFQVPADNRPNLPHPALRYLLAPHSVEAENYRSIRTAMLVTAEQAAARTILVSSPEPGDGKTTLVSNLAIAVAQSGKRVLLIDADLRRPNVHTLFRVAQEIGLTEVLTGEIDALNAVRPTVINGLSLMTAGHPPANPAELLSSPRLQQLLRTLRDEFDFIFIDAPPLLAVSDPCILARQTDGLLIVTRINKNTRGAAVRVRDLVRDQGIRVLGAIANGAAPGQAYYGEYLNTEPDSVGTVSSQTPQLTSV